MTPRLGAIRLVALLLTLLWMCSAALAEPTALYTYRLVNVYPHDANAFTQGLAFDRGFLYEGTGLYGQSTLRKVELKTGKVIKRYGLPARFFGEGITVFGENIIQTSWSSNVAFVYNKRSFELRQTFVYPTEAWGLTHNGRQLILSDGTATLRFLDPRTFREVDRIEVYDGKQSVSHLNELEFVRGEILANVWKTERIARIAPESGRVTGWIDLSGILKAEERSARVDVLNGIAHDAGNDRLFVTGKLWPKLFEIEIVPAAK
ncbi:MAG: glutaminyl-peptide cyclotransferase [Acidiferrobacterales bacterium]|nr:glutaminyl-peptide cyclotransferase [Acidiferrobacterales bacterium]